MAQDDSGGGFIGRNRTPRVHITTNLETYGSEPAVEIPFIMGVLSDLAGKSTKLKPVDERKFQDLDVDNFDKMMEAITPQVGFRVNNVLSEDGGELGVNLAFKKLSDFSPGAIAERLDGVKELYEARRQLDALERYMDGKPDAEKLLADILSNKEFMTAIKLANLPEPDPAKPPETDNRAETPNNARGE